MQPAEMSAAGPDDAEMKATSETELGKLKACCWQP
jgi:hypothetical protein